MNLKNIVLVALFLCLGLLGGTVGGRVIAAMKPLPEVPVDSGDYSSYLSQGNEPLILISTSTCPFCKKTRDYLTLHRIAYRDYVTDQSELAKSMYKSIGESGVPVLLTAKHKMVGFSPKSIDKMLAMDSISDARQ